METADNLKKELFDLIEREGETVEESKIDELMAEIELREPVNVNLDISNRLEIIINSLK